MQQRPLGVTIIAIFLILGGIIGILAGLAGFGLFGTAEGAAPAFWSVYSGSLLLVSIIELIVGIGLWMLKGWAWTIAAVVVILRVILDVISLFFGFSFSPIIALVIHAIVLWYLFRPEVKQAFGK